MSTAESLSPLPAAEREAPRPATTRLSRSTLVRRWLVGADLVGLSLAFATTIALYGLSAPGAHARPQYELLVILLSLPAWTLLAASHGLYRHDAERVGHSTVDDFMDVVHVITLGSWVFFITIWATRISEPRPDKLIAFWLFATLFVTGSRSLARAWCRRSPAYVQRTVVVGGGDVGQLVARKLLQHPEYGIHLVGLVDESPKQRRGDLGELKLLGSVARLRDIVAEHDVDRVIVAFSNLADTRTAQIVRELRGLGTQVDIVPRLYEVVGTRVDIHSVEALPLVGLPPVRATRSSLHLKRAVDLAGATLALALLSPLFAFIAWRVRRSSPGPIFFRQTRLGMDMREFTALKFRSMWTGTDDREHHAYIAKTMSAEASVGTNGLYKLERQSAVTPFGRWLRKTSLDELPQLLNVLRGDMSLVGPRPCIPYETQHFRPHHFERFLMPAGLTGLWQVMARAHSSFGEALEMDVVYVRSWSLGLDLRLLCRTPLQLLRQGETT